jgi:RNA recognition motif-containing protein
MKERKLFVGNLCNTVDGNDLKELFDCCGEVRLAHIPGEQGFGIVVMSNRMEAEKAKRELDGTELKGRLIKVDYSLKGLLI